MKYEISEKQYDDLFKGIEEVEIDDIMDTAPTVKTGNRRKGAAKYHGNIVLERKFPEEEYPYIINSAIDFLNKLGEHGVTFEHLANMYEDIHGDEKSKMFNNIYRMLDFKVLMLDSLEKIIVCTNHKVNIEYVKFKDIKVIDGKGKITPDISEDNRKILGDNINGFIKFLEDMDKEGFNMETLKHLAKEAGNRDNHITNILYRMKSKGVLTYANQSMIAELLGYRATINYIPDSKIDFNHNTELN